MITPRGQTILSKVCDLIDLESGTGDEALIRNIFNLVDARRILQIPLHYQEFDDFVAWQPNRTRFFSSENCVPSPVDTYL